MVECGLIKKIASYLGALDLTLDSMIPDTVKSLRTFVIRKKMLAMLGDISEEGKTYLVNYRYITSPNDDLYLLNLSETFSLWDLFENKQHNHQNIIRLSHK